MWLFLWGSLSCGTAYCLQSCVILSENEIQSWWHLPCTLEAEIRTNNSAQVGLHHDICLTLYTSPIETMTTLELSETK